MINESGLDFINLVLGTGRETDLFWQQIISKQIWYDYGFQFDVNKRFDLPKGLLLCSILYQCDISYPISTENIFSKAIPFSKQSEFKVSTHYYKLKTSLVSKSKTQINQSI